MNSLQEDQELYQKSQELLFGTKGNMVSEQAGFQLLLEAANKGVLEAQGRLGKRYCDGCSFFPPNKEKAITAAIHAAAFHEPCASEIYAVCYGDQFPFESSEMLQYAFDGYQERASSGDVLGMCDLALFYQEFKNDDANGFYWFKKAADLECVLAQFHLGMCYDGGWGTNEDAKKAFEYYSMAASQNFVKAKLYLGYCYAYGTYVSIDMAKAFDMYKEAADFGCCDAQYMVGLSFEKGVGVQKDVDNASRYYGMAAGVGHKKASIRFSALNPTP